MRSTRPTVHAKLLIGANLMKFHQIQNIDVCTGYSHPNGAHALHVAAACIVSTASAVAPTPDVHSWHTSALLSLSMHAAVGSTIRRHLRSLGNPHERLLPASRRQNHSIALSHDGGVDKAVPVARLWLR